MRNLKKLGLKYYKRQRAPKYNQKQLAQIPKRCRKLRQDITDHKSIAILYDDTYFTFSEDNMLRNTGFYPVNEANTPIETKIRTQSIGLIGII